MRFAWMKWGVALTVAGLPILVSGPLEAQDQSGIRPVAEELGSRTKTQAAPEGAPKGMSDSRVRVMSTYALSLLPDEVQDKEGNKIKLDKSDPNIYLIPLDDARRIIRVATRSAYAEACQLGDLGDDNFQAMYQSEKARNVWSKEQLMFVQALHSFSAAYFAGRAKALITEEPSTTASGNAKTEGPTTTVTMQKPECPPGQKEKVAAAIKAYVKSTGVTIPPPVPAAPQGAVPQAPAMPATPKPVQMAPAPMAPAPVAGSAN
jgi:hypothetical protein